jgi:hypothetical protein
MLRKSKVTEILDPAAAKSAPQTAAKPTPPAAVSQFPANLPSMDPPSTTCTMAPPEPASSIVAFHLSGFLDAIIAGYKEDTQFRKSLKEGVESGVYVLRDGLLYTGPGRDGLCIPNFKVNGGRDGGEKNLREMIISHFHDGTLEFSRRHQG